MYKKAWWTCKLVVLLNKPISVLTFLLLSPSSLLKLPNCGTHFGSSSHLLGILLGIVLLMKLKQKKNTNYLRWKINCNIYTSIGTLLEAINQGITLTEMPTPGNLKSGDSLFCITTPYPNFNDQPPLPDPPISLRHYMSSSTNYRPS